MEVGHPQAMVYDGRRCHLGEGPLWHPQRKQLFWFDITKQLLLTREGGIERAWHFDEMVSCCAWVDRERLLIASETSLFLFHVDDGTRRHVAPLESDRRATRSNDGRADPQGGFWVGTMGKNLEPGLGAIYRWFRGSMRPIYEDISIPNAICFSPNGDLAYFADTPQRRIMRQSLDPLGWPVGEPETFVASRDEDGNPDGAIVDAQGCLWNAQWGASRIVRYSPNGGVVSHFSVPASQVTCPAFGGQNLQTLFVTSAAQELSCSDDSRDGMTFFADLAIAGQPEHRVIVP